MIKITLDYLKETNEVFSKLNNLWRWTEFDSQPKYNELNKQALNCIITFFIAKRAEHEGKTIIYKKFPHIAIGRAFAKAYVYYDTPEHKIDEICEISGISKSKFDVIASTIIAEKTDEDFAKFVSEEKDEYEVKIYKAATKIATYIELLEQQHNSEYVTELQDISRDLEKYMDVPGVKEFSDVDSPFFKLFQQISKLRNQSRWSTHSRNLECSVLGHQFETGVWAYLIGLDESNFDEEYATKMFFMGVFHDIAEVWTKDIPYSIKERMPGFRKATEEYERRMLEKHMYSIVPKYLEEALRNVMLEDEVNAKYKKKVKDADYLSADAECYRFLESGSRKVYICDVVINRQLKNCSEVYVELHNYFVEYAKKVKSNL